MKPIAFFALVALAGCDNSLSPGQEAAVRTIAREEARRVITQETTQRERRQKAAYEDEKARLNARADDQVDSAGAALDALTRP